MSEQGIPLKRVAELVRTDAFAERLGVELEEIRPGYARMRMPLDGRHRNFLGMVHGGAIFGLADAAFAAASNSFGSKAVAVHVGIDYLAAPGDSPWLVAEVELVSRAGKIGNYDMRVVDAGGTLVATCRGWVYHTGKPLAQLDA